MKLGTVTKPDKRNKITLKNIENNVISTNYKIAVFFWFMANLKQYSGCIVCKFYLFINSNYLFYKNWK